MNIAEVFVDRHLAEGRGARTAFRFAGRAVTYTTLADQVNRCGNALRERGVGRGDRVLLALEDSPAFAAAFWGTARIGAVAVPVNTLMTTAEYEFLLDDSGATAAVVEPGIAEPLRAVAGRCPALRSLLATGGAFEGALAQASPALDPAPTSAGDVAYWAYTSGSTGAPKGALHTHDHCVAAADRVGVEVFGVGPDDLCFSASKCSFSFGLGNTLLFPARVGAASVLEPERLTAERAFEVIARERPTVFFAVATLYARMLQVEDAAGRWDLSSLRLCVSSGEALPPALFDAWRARFGLELTDVIGSTEALHDFIANRPGQARRGSTGRLVPGFEARIVHDDGQPVPPGAAGHLLIKGPTTAPSYWNRPERTAATMLGQWLRTGDMFRQDAEGWFYFEGRSDDMLKVAGQWVSPAEVEARLVEHPAVVEAAVVARQDASGLLRPHAFVVLHQETAGTAALAAALTTFVRERLAGYKVPATIDVVAELPKTATGKIQRYRLRGDVRGTV
ncbi:MAG: benzoate-CoA ligase family protein [Candidatus Rokubacteria bacterium]|nr:benzoate-CoA ligase family protein [Candidatus Rokubacteria bacterium]